MDIQNIKTLTVIGAGDMGHGIAEAALIAGYKVYLQDIKQEFVDRGVSRIKDSLEKLVSKEKVSAEHHKKILSDLMVPCVEIEKAVKETDLVIEAAPELMDLKKEIFEAVDKAAPSHTLLASNTSTMKITDIASATRRPEKFLGLHYFNPAILMKTVEVIRGEKTTEETMKIGTDFVLKNNKVPVRVEKDVPGFIVNRVQAPTGVLLGCILDTGEISPESIDAYMKTLGMPMGPYETMDYTGIDISYYGGKYFAESVHPDFAPGTTLEELVKAGNLGKKTGKGIFDWTKGRPEIDPSQATDKLDFMDLIAVQVNEATKIIEMGACGIADVDTAIVNGTGAFMGPMALAKDQNPADLSERLEKLAEKFKKEIFKPTQMIKDGAFKE